MSREISARNGEPRPTRRGPRALWKGTLGFGLVSIPVRLHRAVQKRGVRFHELHDADGGHIRRRAVCAIDGAPVPREHIVRGFELERGQHVQIAPAELEAFAPESSRLIDIDEFVELAEIDPILYDRSYWLSPGEGGGRAYGLLLQAMRSLRKVAVARMVLRSKQLVTIVRPAGAPGRGEALALSVLDYADEIVPAITLEGLPGPDARPDARELALAERLVASRAGRFELERYHDEHRERVLAFIRSKAAGEAPAPPPAEKPAVQLDLVGALEASLSEAERHRAA